MPDQELTSEVLENSTTSESTEATPEQIENIADETINNIEKEELTTPEVKEEEETLENIELPKESKELTKEDHILRRKEKQLEREQKRRAIDEKNAEIERLKQANEEASKRAFVAEVNSFRAPIREDFETDEDFIDSRLQYNLAKTTVERIRQEEQAQVSKAKEVFAEKIGKAEKDGQDKYHDFDEVTEACGSLTNKALVDAVLDSDYSADVFYILGKHPSIREKLNAMDPMKAIKEIAKLEQRFEQVLKAKKVVKPATKIIETINGKNGVATKKPLSQYTQAELDKLDNKEFTRLRKEQSKFTTY